MPESTTDIRPLTQTEIERLEDAFGGSVDRAYLVHWVSDGIADVVRLSALPTQRELRADLVRIAREGRQWLRRVREYSDIFPLRERVELEEFGKSR